MKRHHPSLFCLLALAACQAPAGMLDMAPDDLAPAPDLSPPAAPPPHLPTARAGMASAIGLDGNVYTIGGYTYVVATAVEKYDPKTNSWTLMPELNQRRYAAGAATASDGRVFVFGGRTNLSTEAVNELGSVEVYDPVANTWMVVATTMPVTRSWMGVVAGMDGRIYLIGGLSQQAADGTSIGYGNVTATVDVYDPAANSWSAGAPLNEGRSMGGYARGSDGRIYIYGGVGSKGFYMDDGEVYDPAAQTWSSISSDGIAITSNALAAGSDGRIYTFGGEIAIGRQYVDTDVSGAYTPADDGWSDIPSLPMPRFDATAAALPDGRILIIGGTDSATATYPTYYDDVFVYSVKTSSWR